MQFFLHEIAGRILGAYLAVDSFRQVRKGLQAGQIRNFNNDLLAWVLFDQSWVAHRKTEPVLFWTTISLQGLALLGCLFVALFGWR